MDEFLISGNHIVGFYTSYENIIAIDDKGDRYYFSPSELQYLFYERWFDVEKKKTRTWITVHKTYNDEKS